MKGNGPCQLKENDDVDVDVDVNVFRLTVPTGVSSEMSITRNLKLKTDME